MKFLSLVCLFFPLYAFPGTLKELDLKKSKSLNLISIQALL